LHVQVLELEHFIQILAGSPEQQGWLHKFLGFDFVIEYKPGRDDIAADALSRSFMMALCSQQSLLLQQIHHAIQQDRDLATVKAQCELVTILIFITRFNTICSFGIIVWLCLRTFTLLNKYWLNTMLHPLGVTLEFNALKLASVSNSFGHTLLNLSQNASYVSQPSLVPLCHQAFSSHCQFHHKFGMMSQWIL
jgi:hypothetical protein